MKKILVILILLINLTLAAQFEQISVGQGYQEQTFYSLEDGTLRSGSYDLWDIAFTTQGIQDAGVFINEAAALGDLTQVELYNTFSSDFNQTMVLDTGNWERLYNPETDWRNGAFNTIKDENDVFDYGWGQYNSSATTVEGKVVYAIHLRNGQWKKIFIESLFLEWVFKYSNLDGSELVEMVIPKADHPGKVLAYYSLENNEVVDIEPFGWDLLFTRYNTYTDDGNGNFRDYVVTGVLSGLDVKVAEFDDVDPTAIEPQDVPQDEFKTPLDQIGFDWKTVDINSSIYSIDSDRVYFVKASSDSVCKIQFIDFEGATTGVTTIMKDCDLTARVIEPMIEGIQSLSIFPNPTSDRINILADFEEASYTEVLLIDASGRVAQKNIVEFIKGFQHKSLNINVGTGAYTMVIKSVNKTQSFPVIVQR